MRTSVRGASEPTSASEAEKRCLRCRNRASLCACAQVVPLELVTRVVLVMHNREFGKAAATGPFALSALQNADLYLYGKREAPLDLCHLHTEGRRVLVLFPAEGATPLASALQANDDRPITLVVPDGTWRQAGRARLRVPGLKEAEVVALDEANMDTFRALARALGMIESSEIEEKLAEVFVHSQVELPQEPSESLPHAPLEIVYQDDCFIAVNKPSGMLVHRGWARDEVPALQILREQVGRRVFPVHRLDRATSGVLIFALSSELARDMQQLFDEAMVSKRYLAVCRGNSLKAGRLDHPLAAELGAKKLPASTEFRLLGTFERYGLVEARPLTGRTHQIRKHLKHLAHPIIGDVRYGKGEHNRIFRERYNFSRLALHCESMSFPHPRTRAQITLHAPLPPDFEQLMNHLGWSSVL